MFSLKITKRGDKFAQMERRAPQEAARISKNAADQTVAIAKQLAPVSSNPPPGHVHMRDTVAAEQVSKTRYRVGVGAYYASFVEYGTVHMDAQPFLTPALELARREYMRELETFFLRVAA